jgi:hypothetical protein
MFCNFLSSPWLCSSFAALRRATFAADCAVNREAYDYSSIFQPAVSAPSGRGLGRVCREGRSGGGLWLIGAQDARQCGA